MPDTPENTKPAMGDRQDDLYITFQGRRMLRVIGGDGTEGEGGDDGGENGDATPQGDELAGGGEPEVLEGAQNPDAVKRAIRAEREAAKAARQEAAELRAKLAEYEDRDKTDLEKATGRAERAEKRAAEAEAKLLRLEVAIAKGVPSDLIEFLSGSTREEVEQKAEALLKHVKPEDGATPPGSFDGGTRKPAPKKGLDDQIAEAEAKGDWKTVDRLNAVKLAQIATGQ